MDELEVILFYGLRFVFIREEKALNTVLKVCRVVKSFLT